MTPVGVKSIEIQIHRGDIVEVSFDPTKGDEINKTRPAVVISNNYSNEYSSLVIVVPISSIKNNTKRKPYYAYLTKSEGGLDKDSFVHCGQIRTIDKKVRILRKIGSLSDAKMNEINKALKISLALI